MPKYIVAPGTTTIDGHGAGEVITMAADRAEPLMGRKARLLPYEEPAKEEKAPAKDAAKEKGAAT